MAQMDREVVEGPPLNVTLPGRECQLTVADVGNMPAQEFKALWQVCQATAVQVSICMIIIIGIHGNSPTSNSEPGN